MENLSKLIDLFSSNRKKKFILLIFLSFIGTILEIISIGLLIPLVSSFSEDNSFINEIFTKFSIDPSLISFFSFEKLILVLLAIYIAKFLFLISFVYYRNSFFFSFQLELIDRLFENTIRKKYLYHVFNNSAKMVKDISEEIHHLTIGYTGSISNIIIETVLVTSLIIILLVLQTNTTIVVLILTALISFLAFSVLRKRISNLGIQREKFNFVNLKNLFQALGGIKEIKIFQKENEIINNFKKNSLRLKNVNWLISFFNDTPKIFFELIAVSSFLVILYLFVKVGYSFSEIIANFVVIFAVFIRIMPSINKLITSFVNLTVSKNSVNIIHDQLVKNFNKDKEDYKKNTIKIGFHNKIEVKDLSFSYNSNDKKVLQNINFEIKRGEIFGLVGETGCGKTTIIDLLIGLLDPHEGKISSDGTDISINKIEWFKKIGYVPQNMFLNDDTIKSNIAFSSDKNLIEDHKVIQAAKKSKLFDTIQGKKEQLNTRVGERGSMLSGGQKQRLGIARALYGDSEILVLDEFTSALDKDTEKELMEELLKFKGEKTIILSTHKLLIQEYCDKVFDVKLNKIIKR